MNYILLGLTILGCNGLHNFEESLSKTNHIDISIRSFGDSLSSSIPFCISTDNGQTMSKFKKNYYMENGKPVMKLENQYDPELIIKKVPRGKIVELINEIRKNGFSFSDVYPKEPSGTLITVYFDSKEYCSEVMLQKKTVLDKVIFKYFSQYQQGKIQSEKSDVSQDDLLEVLDELGTP